jgi:hypothetical protein
MSTSIAERKMLYNTTSGTHVLIEEMVSQKFIYRIPYAWQKKANTLTGKAGQVGIALWFLVGVKKQRSFKVTREVEQLSGCCRQTFSKNLTALATAGLISIEHQPSGKRPTITVLDVVV